MIARSSIAFLLVAGASAQCGGGFKIAGSSTVEPVAAAWAQGYGAKCSIPVITDVTDNPPTGG
jgi:ABC-type phosphate transport system substrate-binding protein